MKRKMYIFITIIIIFSISLVWIIKACNNRKQSEFETESIISDDHVKITKLTSENFNIIVYDFLSCPSPDLLIVQP